MNPVRLLYGKGIVRLRWGSGCWVLLLVVLLGLSTAGCLFPPVAAPVDHVGPGNPGGLDPSPTVFQQRHMLNSTTGAIEAAFSQMDVEQGSRMHVFDLPSRLDAVRMVLEWEDDVYDLDLAARLVENPADPEAASWEGENTTGSVGDPDSPALLEVTDRSAIFFETPTQLRVTVFSEVAVDVGYTLTVRATYLVPEETGP